MKATRGKGSVILSPSHLAGMLALGQISSMLLSNFSVTGIHLISPMEPLTNANAFSTSESDQLCSPPRVALLSH